MGKELGTKWLKVCKILWLIAAVLGIISLLNSLSMAAVLFEYFPAFSVVYIVTTLAVLALTVFAYTAVSSLSAKRYKYIFLLLLMQAVSSAVIAYFYVLGADISTRAIYSAVAFLFVTLAWSLPNAIYFKRRKYLFIGADSDDDIKTDAKETAEKAKEEVEPASAEKHKVKVTPKKVSSAAAAESTFPEKAEKKKIKSNKVKNYIICAIGVVCIALGAFCIWQENRISYYKNEVEILNRSVEYKDSNIKELSLSLDEQSKENKELKNKIDGLYHEVNYYAGYRKYMTAAELREAGEKYARENGLMLEDIEEFERLMAPYR